MGGMKMDALTIDEARELVSNESIWPLMRDFLWNFAPQVHPSWLEDLEGLRPDAASSLASSARVRRYILDSLGVEPCFHSFPKDDASRLLLLDGATLEAVKHLSEHLLFEVFRNECALEVAFISIVCVVLEISDAICIEGVIIALRCQ